MIKSYLLALGEFGFDDDGILAANWDYYYIGWILFLCATLLNFVVMCNLLISIFSRVHEEFTPIKIWKGIELYGRLTQDMYTINKGSAESKAMVDADTNDKSLLFRAIMKPPSASDAKSIFVDDVDEEEAEIEKEKANARVQNLLDIVEKLRENLDAKTKHEDAKVNKMKNTIKKINQKFM